MSFLEEISSHVPIFTSQLLITVVVFNEVALTRHATLSTDLQLSLYGFDWLFSARLRFVIAQHWKCYKKTKNVANVEIYQIEFMLANIKSDAEICKYEIRYYSK